MAGRHRNGQAFYPSFDRTVIHNPLPNQFSLPYSSSEWDNYVRARGSRLSSGSAIADRLKGLDQKRTELTPGTVLVREWDRKSHCVMVLADGFAWNERTVI